MGSIKRWTPAEDEIVRTCSISKSLKRLPHRTMLAIKSARVRLRVGTQYRRWSKVENRRLLKFLHEPNLRLARRFKNRTVEAVRHQRSIVSGTPGATPWKTTDLAKLKKLYPSAPRSEVLCTFPNRTWHAIKNQADRCGWRRTMRLGTAPNELREAVRARAREDGIPLCQLGAQTGCGGYFQDRQSKTVDLNKIARAVAFFGGKLVIDWQDE